MSEDDTVELRVAVPRAALVQQAPRPIMISQRTCELVGLTRRDYLELLRRSDCPLRPTRIGKLRLVETEALLAWMRQLAEEQTRSTAPTEAEPDPADEVLREMGLRAIAGGRR